MPDTGVPEATVTIKKYANRRLYNTATSSYVTLDNLCQMVKAGTEFQVFDARTGEDITRSVLTQIIVEEEGKGHNLLPISFLRQLIGFYGDNMQWLVPSYLETSMKTFSRNQEQMRTYLSDAFGGLFPFGSFEQMAKQNMTMVERAMKVFSPFGENSGEAGAAAPNAAEQAAGAASAALSEAESAVALAQLKRQLDQLQQQIETLVKPGDPAPKGKASRSE
jgi:polyhydroxyalkanoate synthesis repressor PhaR